MPTQSGSVGQWPIQMLWEKEVVHPNLGKGESIRQYAGSRNSEDRLFD